MKKKVAIITGITGQDGSYLAQLLLKKNYNVHGIKRRASTVNNYRIDDLYNKYYQNIRKPKFFLHYGDVTDSLNISELILKIKPDEIYNLAAQSHVKVSFETPEYTANADALGVLRILETIKRSKNKKIKFYQASTSEMFGSSPPPQSEKSNFQPKSPYGVAKLFGYNGYIELNALTIGTIAIAFISATYSSEVIRAAYLAINKGQVEAAKALGLNKLQIFLRVMGPQIIRHALPGIGNVWQITLKDTSLISVTGLVEIMRQTRIASNVEHSPLTFLITAAFLYLFLTTFSGKFFKILELNYSKGYS